MALDEDYMVERSVIWEEGVAPVVGHLGCGRKRRMGVRCGLLAWIDEVEQREGGSLARRRH